jgi:hypothetical protein
LRRHELLERLHELLEPRTYFEIGVRTGTSLALSRTTSVGVDPFFRIDREIRCDVHLVRTSSDEFFAREHPFAYLPEPVVDLAFIDGMHLAEYALRDLVNTEKYTHPGSVIVIDDMLPRSVDEAGRTRRGTAARGGPWAGDVYKLVPVLRRHRPDLVVIEVDTRPTGTVVVIAPDRTSRVLEGVYDDLVADLVVEDPQVVPQETLARTHAVPAQQLLEAPIWSELVSLRGLPHDEALTRAHGLARKAGLTTAVPA